MNAIQALSMCEDSLIMLQFGLRLIVHVGTDLAMLTASIAASNEFHSKCTNTLCHVKLQALDRFCGTVLHVKAASC